MEDVTEDLIQTRNEIRKKYLDLKRGDIDQMVAREKAFKPIIDPLKEILQNEEDHVFSPKINSTPLKRHNSDIIPPPAPKKLIRKNSFHSIPLNELKENDATGNAEDHFDLSPESSFLTKNYTSLFQDKVGNIAGQYMKLYLGENPDLDPVYGIRRELNEDGQFLFKIGDSDLDVEHNDIKIGDRWYEGTPGLFELMVKKHPVNYASTDLKTYYEILLKTNAHRLGYMPGNQIRGNRGFKYRNIIKPLIEQKRGSSYKYWNDPNELVDRLRLLIASKEAGNSTHNNEIISIIEELTEAGYVYD